MITVIAGGVGAARLLVSLRHVVPSDEVTAIVNVADDLRLHGLMICPDLDTVTYTLAGLNNDELGWGLRGESWRVMDELAALGGQSWFRLGDRDLATHLYRTQRLSEGATKTQVADELRRHHGVPESILPATDDDVATIVDTVEGTMSFQEYFVGRHHDVTVTSLHFSGADRATAAPGVIEAITNARRIVIAPSNPVLSIDPIMAITEVRDAIAARRADVVAVSPLIGGRALKGPADRIMIDLGIEATNRGIAQHYRDLAATLVIDESDRDDVAAVAETGLDAVVTTTLMAEADNARRLAMAVSA